MGVKVILETNRYIHLRTLIGNVIWKTNAAWSKSQNTKWKSNDCIYSFAFIVHILVIIDCVFSSLFFFFFFFRPWPKGLAIIVDNVPIDFCLACRPALIISAWFKHFFVFGEVWGFEHKEIRKPHNQCQTLGKPLPDSPQICPRAEKRASFSAHIEGWFLHFFYF